MLERTAFHSTVRRVPFVDGLAGVTETIGPSSASLYPQAIFLPSVFAQNPSIKNDGHLNIGMFHALIVGKVAESFIFKRLLACSMHSLSVCNRRVFCFKRLKARRHSSLNALVSCSSSIETSVPSHRIVFVYGDRLEWRGDRPNDPGLTMLIVTLRFPETKRIPRAKVSRPNLRVFVPVVNALIDHDVLCT